MDKTRPRIDPCICLNNLTAFYTYGRGTELSRTLKWVYEVLVHRAYIDGTRYYTPECFLFFMARLLTCEEPTLQSTLMPVFTERVQERIGVEGDAIALGMRIFACDVAGLKNVIDRQTLLSMQCEDGGWPIGWMYKFPTANVRIGSRGLATALAVSAFKELDFAGQNYKE